MGKLAKILEYTYAGNSERSRLMNSTTFPSDIKELIMSESMEEDTIVNEEIGKALIAGAENRSVIRKVLPIVTVNTHNTLIPYNLSPSGTASPVGEGASIPTLNTYYSSGSVKPKKYATNVQITNELLEDFRWDLVEYEVMRAGALLENSLNSIGLSEMLDMQNGTTPADIDPSRLHLMIPDLARARESLKNKYWGGGKVSCILSPTAFRYLYASGQNITVSVYDGEKLMGMEMHELMTGLDNRTWNDGTRKYWDSTDSANHYYGIVLDSDNYAVIGMQEDIHIKSRYNDPIQDLTGLIASMKFDVKVINDKAAVRILTK